MKLTGSSVCGVEIERLHPAPWNPKIAGEADEIAKLAESIRVDGSAGIPAVRRISDTDYEVIDGNHRLAALALLGVKLVTVEDFGEITKATAILISHRRNFQWFAESDADFGRLLRDDVLADGHGLQALAEFMPETADELDDLVAEPDDDDDDTPEHEPLAGRKIVVTVDDETFSAWEDWCRLVEEQTTDDTDEEAFRLALEFAIKYVREKNAFEAQE